MRPRNLFIFGAIAFVIIGVAIFFRLGTEKPKTEDNTAGLIVGKNAIYVSEQSPSQSVTIAVAVLERTGFVAIHEDADGSPGKILGVSALLKEGETKNLSSIALARETEDGETLYAMIHLDDGDGAFDAENDTPAQDPLGASPVMTEFFVTKDAADAAESPEVSL